MKKLVYPDMKTAEYHDGNNFLPFTFCSDEQMKVK